VTRQAWIISAAIVGPLVIALACFLWWTRPPQMGADEEVFTAVDALFTAVTAQDENLLDQCEKRLLGLQEEKKLPPEAANYLAGLIAKARQGRWEAAAEKLYDFMKAQRREGARPSKLHSTGK
jgi:hypothetical protein